MKPYYIFQVENYKNSQSKISNDPQGQLIEGNSQDPKTSVLPQKQQYFKEYDYIKINHEIRVEQFGYTTKTIDNKSTQVRFNEYLTPKSFSAYYNRSKQLMIFQADKKTSNSAFKTINKEFQKVLKLNKVPFNFHIADKLINEYSGVWFRNINSNVSSIGMSGQDVQEDDYFDQLKEEGDISNITIRFEHMNAMHEIMITKNSGVVLIRNYDNIDIELELVTSLFDRLISKVWEMDPSVTVNYSA